jgi:hypothetical protein
VGIRDQLLWRRDWSKHPNDWKLHLGFAVVWLVLGALYIGTGNLFGIGYLALSAVWVGTATYTYRRSHQGRGSRGHQQEDGEPN